MIGQQKSISRIAFFYDSAKPSVGPALALNFPGIVPASVFGKNAQGNWIDAASIGCSRISITHYIITIACYRGTRTIVVYDLDKAGADAGPQAFQRTEYSSVFRCVLHSSINKFIEP